MILEVSGPVIPYSRTESGTVVPMKTYLLLHLQAVHHRSQLAQDLVRFLVELELSGDQVRQVSKGFGGVEYLAP